MRRILLILLLLPFASFGQDTDFERRVQPTYIDALRLVTLEEAYWQSNDSIQALIAAETRSILLRYGEWDEIRRSDYLGRLVSTYFENMQAPLESDETGARDGNSIMPESPGQVSASSFAWQAALINGLSDFMASRFQEEVIHYGLTNLFDRIQTQEKELFNALLPETGKEVRRLQAAKSYYSSDLVFLRQLIRHDLLALPERVLTHTEDVFPRLDPSTADYFNLAGGVYLAVSQGIPLPELFYRLQSLELNDPQLKNAFELTYLFSEAMKDTVGSDRIWIAPSQLTGYAGRESLSAYFLGLLQLQLNAYLPVRDIGSVRHVFSFFSEMNSAARFLRTKNFNLNTDEGIYLLKQINVSLRKYMEEASRRGLLHVNLENLGYLDKYASLIEPFLKADYQRGIITFMRVFEENLPETSDSDYRRALVFMIQLGEATSASEMKNLLEAYALPLGGSSIKRSSAVNVSVNGYVGLTGGWETAFGSTDQTRGNLGLAAPIGLSITYKGRLTLMASLIDLGSIVNVRLNNDTTAYSGLRLEHFVTPGAGLYYNIKKAPISFGAHYNYIPDFRTIQYQDGGAIVSETNLPVSRLNVSVLIDIPFFTLFNKTE